MSQSHPIQPAPPLPRVPSAWWVYGPALALVLVVLTVCAYALVVLPDTAVAHVPASPARSSVTPEPIVVVLPACVEDEPCWHWSTMGNRKRGIVSLWGTPLVVGPCRYARMYKRAASLGMAHLLGPRLRGDAWARAHGCK